MANYKKNGIPLVVHYVRLCPNDIKRAQELGLPLSKICRDAISLAIIEDELKQTPKNDKSKIYGEFNARRIKRTDHRIPSLGTSLLCAPKAQDS